MKRREEALNLKQKVVGYITDKRNHRKLITVVLILIVLELVLLIYLKKDNFNLSQSGNSAQISQVNDPEEVEDDDDVIDIEDLGAID